MTSETFKEVLESIDKAMEKEELSLKKEFDYSDIGKSTGVVKEMKDSEYFSMPYYSSTAIKTYEKNPELINYNRTPDNPHFFYEMKTSKAMIVGSVVHKALLEPVDFMHNREVYLGLLSKKEVEIVSNLVENAQRNTEVKKLLEDCKYKEKVIIFDVGVKREDDEKVTKLKCKAKIDLFTKAGFLVDFKTCPSLEEMPKTIDTFRYDMQLSFYQHALESLGEKVKGVAILALEKQPPYSSHVFFLSKDYIMRGATGGHIYSKEVRGWKQILPEMFFSPKRRFKDKITLLDMST